MTDSRNDSNPFVPDVPEAIRAVSPELYIYMAEQAEALRRAYAETQELRAQLSQQLTQQVQAIGQDQARINADLFAQLDGFKTTIERGDGFIQITRRYDKMFEDANYSLIAISRRIGKITRDSAVIGEMDSIQATANFQALAGASEKNARLSWQRASVEASAASSNARLAQVYRTTAGYFAEVSQSSQLEAKLSENEAVVSAQAAFESSESAKASLTEAGASAEAARQSALTAETKAGESGSSARASEESAARSKTSADGSATSAEASRQSSVASESSRQASKTSADASLASSQTAKTQADAASASASTARTEADRSTARAGDSAASASQSDTRATAAQTSAGQSAASAETSRGYRDESNAAAGRSNASATNSRDSATAANGSAASATESSRLSAVYRDQSQGYRDDSQAILTENRRVSASQDGKLQVYWGIVGQAGGNRAAIELRLSNNVGDYQGFDITGNVRIYGNLLVAGTITSDKIDRDTFVKYGTGTWSGNILAQGLGETVDVPGFQVVLGTIYPNGSYTLEIQAPLEKQLSDSVTTVNGRPYYRYIAQDGGLNIKFVDPVGNVIQSYVVQAGQTSVIQAVNTGIVAVRIIATLFRGTTDTGMIDDGDYYYSYLSQAYRLTYLSIIARWSAI